jgi:hypothetical protein
LYSLCQTIGKYATTQIAAKVEVPTQGITSNELRRKFSTQMATWMEKVGMPTSAAQKAEIANFPLKTTTGSEDPRYVAFWTSEKILQMFAQELSNDPKIADMLPLPPSSTIVVEFAKASDTSNDLVASLFINDQ